MSSLALHFFRWSVRAQIVQRINNDHQPLPHDSTAKPTYLRQPVVERSRINDWLADLREFPG